MFLPNYVTLLLFFPQLLKESRRQPQGSQKQEGTKENLHCTCYSGSSKYNDYIGLLIKIQKMRPPFLLSVHVVYGNMHESIRCVHFIIPALQFSEGSKKKLRKFGHIYVQTGSTPYLPRSLVWTKKKFGQVLLLSTLPTYPKS